MFSVAHSYTILSAPSSRAYSKRMNSLSSCCRLFRQTLLTNNVHCAALQAQSRRAFASPKAALNRSRQAKEAVTSDNVAENKVCRKCNHGRAELTKSLLMFLYARKRHTCLHFVCSSLAPVQAKALEQVMKDLNARFGRGTIMQLGQAEPQKL